MLKLFGDIDELVKKKASQIMVVHLGSIPFRVVTTTKLGPMRSRSRFGLCFRCSLGCWVLTEHLEPVYARLYQRKKDTEQHSVSFTTRRDPLMHSDLCFFVQLVLEKPTRPENMMKLKIQKGSDWEIYKINTNESFDLESNLCPCQKKRNEKRKSRRCLE